MKAIIIKASDGLFYVSDPAGESTGRTLEQVLAARAPAAPPEYVAHAAEVLLGILGPLGHIQVVEGLADTQSHQ